ncbi:flagellar protein FliS (plasmid) [Pontibacillus sp. ALD_SL1]|uniref:flagellar protein FliS n=1 Tax=Pontibacillus sp. ALD_SL1 TaxID=2777185 RepID=UPI001A95CF07|nr:flagellar protein FliS [Pontibacillus sp. ALD_SL1]QST03027.1 flagellar protein FliS [Pontibacillus sp. ALD_SL1]
MSNWKRFDQNEFVTSDPDSLTILLYERCLLFMKKAQKDFHSEDHKESVLNALDKAYRIVNELSMQLNKDEALPASVKDVIQSMEQDYLTAALCIEEAVHNGNLEKLDIAILTISNLLEAYREVKRRGQ